MSRGPDESWEMTRRRGYWRYVGSYGLRAWSMTVAIYAILQEWHGPRADGVITITAFAGINLVVWFLLCSAMWFDSERKFRSASTHGGAEGGAERVTS